MKIFIWLALMVPEILWGGGGGLKTPGPLNGKKPGSNRVKVLWRYYVGRQYSETIREMENISYLKSYIHTYIHTFDKAG